MQGNHHQRQQHQTPMPQQRQQQGYGQQQGYQGPDLPGPLRPGQGQGQYGAAGSQHGSTLANLKTAAAGIHLSLDFFQTRSWSISISPFPNSFPVSFPAPSGVRPSGVHPSRTSSSRAHPSQAVSSGKKKLAEIGTCANTKS